jgi:hypothetical protein
MILKLAKIKALAQRTGPEIIWLCEHYSKHHLYAAPPTLPFTALLTICAVEVPSSLAGKETHFKIHYTLILIYENVAVLTPFSSVSFSHHSLPFSLPIMFTLPCIVQTAPFHLGNIIPESPK